MSWGYNFLSIRIKWRYKHRNPILLKNKIRIKNNKIIPLDNCSICLQKLDTKLSCTNCNHWFHEVCLKKWIDRKHKTCPICRTEM